VQRVTSFVLAFLIFASAVVSAVFVIQQVRKEDKSQSTTASTDTTTKPKQETPPVNGNALKGKPLANFTASADRVTDVKTEDLVAGSGAEVTSAAQTVTAHYTGARVVDGIVFESSKDSGKPFTSALSGLIKGWQTGMIGMKAGGTRRLIIPAAQAYGDDASSGRPTGDLVFDIELMDVK
jgi:FKBP-type peptidyl-prolyl cis-trans isomerase